MAEKEGIDSNDSKESESSPPEEIDLNDQIEIIAPEGDPVEPLKSLPEEVVSEEEDSGLPQLDSDIVTEVDLPSDSEKVQAELPSKDIGAENLSQTADEPKDGQSDQSNVDATDFLILEDEEYLDVMPEERGSDPENKAVESQETCGSEIKSQEELEPAENQKERTGKNGNPEKITKTSKTKIVIGLTLLLMIIAGGFIHRIPAYLGFKKEPKPVSLKKPVARKQIKPAPNVATASKQLESAKSLSKSDIYLAKIKDAGRLRDELLMKKEEIYQLKRYYQAGITDLTAQISHELPNSGIPSFAEALKNRRIELNLRTIQRRRSYIQRLEEPIRWIEQGSEELLYLKRKAEFDLQLIDIAGGIDMERHMRQIGAAIHMYRPSARNLAVSRENVDLPTLETIWDQIKNQKRKNGQALQNVTDKEITKEICSGNYERTAELTSMSAATARCLSQKAGSDLFLNRLTALSPSAAEYLSQWRGRWVCINGIEELSPEAAQNLFKWEGNWISLNGLTEFPPELASYLIEWEGNQLELMGLRYDKKNTDQKTLKYLALWEAMGGKLFVADDVRKEIERINL